MVMLERVRTAAEGLVAGAGIFVAWLFYMKGDGRVPKKLASSMSWLYDLIRGKFYIDELYDAIIIRPFRALARFCHRVVDARLIDGSIIHGAARFFAGLGRALRVVHNGQVQQYAVLVVIGIAVLAILAGV